MISSFGNTLTEYMFNDLKTKNTIKFPPELYRIARRKLMYLSDAESLNDLKAPPGNRLERLKGASIDFYSIRINDQYRIVFKWINSTAHEVTVIDYPK